MERNTQLLVNNNKKGSEKNMRKNTLRKFILTGVLSLAMASSVYAANLATSEAGAGAGDPADVLGGGAPLVPSEAYGYYTGLDPFSAGPGIIGITDHPLAAPAYTHPCPVDAMPGGCTSAVDVNGDVTDPQTDPGNANGFSGAGDDLGVWNIPIIDDLLSKMNDEVNATHYTRATMDILFVMAPKTLGGKGLIDQTLDQDLADYTGDNSSCIWGGGGACPAGAYDGVGITARLVQRTAIQNNNLLKSAPGSLGTTGATFNEQLLLTTVKDVTGGNGIFSSYTSFFGADNNVTPTCASAAPGDPCYSAIALGHAPVNHTLPGEIDNHP